VGDRVRHACDVVCRQPDRGSSSQDLPAWAQSITEAGAAVDRALGMQNVRRNIGVSSANGWVGAGALGLWRTRCCTPPRSRRDPGHGRHGGGVGGRVREPGDPAAASRRLLPVPPPQATWATISRTCAWTVAGELLSTVVTGPSLTSPPMATCLMRGNRACPSTMAATGAGPAAMITAQF
jgi:hypothetical protein